MRIHLFPRAIVAAATALAVLLTGCGGADNDAAAEGGSIATNYDLKGATVKVGSKEFTENLILGQLAIAVVEAAGGKAEDKTGISGSQTVRAAQESGEIDLYWDYTGTGWVNILGNEPKNLPEDLFKAVKDADSKNGITWIGPAPLNNSYGLAVKKELADEEGIKTMSDLAAYLKKNPKDNKICAASEFLQRDDGLPGLQKAYGAKFSVVELELGLIYSQVGSKCSTGEVLTTDARVASNDLVSLQDDKKFFVPYNGAVTVTSELVKKHPDLVKLFEELAAALTDEVMMELNGKVDLDGEKPRDVARDWLREKGYIG